MTCHNTPDTEVHLQCCCQGGWVKFGKHLLKLDGCVPDCVWCTAGHRRAWSSLALWNLGGGGGGGAGGVPYLQLQWAYAPTQVTRAVLFCRLGYFMYCSFDLTRV